MNQQTAYTDDAVVAQMTRLLVDAGHAILQSHRLGPTDRDHVAALLAYFDPPPGAHVLDIGSGVGAVAAHMASLRPDLQFTLAQGARVAADMHALPFPDATFDAAMFCFSLGHGRLDDALAEARRVVRPSGIVFLYELTTEQPDAVLERLGYRPHRIDEIMSVARRNGVRATGVSRPQASTADAERMFGSAWTDRGFGQCWPIACRFVV